MTPAQAQIICDAHDIDQLFMDDEELDLLQANNPDLAEAYAALRELAAAAE